MKKLLLLFTFLSIASGILAQVSKTVNLATAGTLFTSLTADELTTITNLTLTGTIDARDFKTMRDRIPLLAVLDLSEVAVAAYNGTGGTNSQIVDYPANEVPVYAFFTFTLNTPPITKKLTSVVLPLSVTSIGESAFWDCNGLTSITIPSSVTSIGDDAFSDCSELTTVTIPSSITSIGKRVFRGSGLTTVTIPSSVTSIGEKAFSYCGRLTTVIIPSSVISIGEGAFSSCYKVKTISIPSSLTSIGNFAFLDCGGLITVDSNNPNYSSLDGVLYDKTQTTLIQCPYTKIGSFTIPSSVTTIGTAAFASCGVTSVTIPSSVTSIGMSAFASCDGLTTISLPSSVITIGFQAFMGCEGLTTAEISSSVTSIGEDAFSFCSNLTTVIIPFSSSLISMGKGAFRYCWGLTNITIPASVTSIGDSAFYGCRGLTTVTISSSVTSIGNSAFDGCIGLTSITSTRPIPVDLSSNYNVFQEIDKNACTLYVPVGSEGEYAVAEQWKGFTNIVEKDLTGIAPINRDQKLTIYPNPTSGKVKLVFDQIPKGGTTLTVNDLTGKTILTQFIQSKVESIDLKGNPPGIYFIKTNMKDGKVQRVILR